MRRRGSQTIEVPVKPVWPKAPRPASLPMYQAWSTSTPRPCAAAGPKPRVGIGPHEVHCGRPQQRAAAGQQGGGEHRDVDAVAKSPAWPDAAERGRGRVVHGAAEAALGRRARQRRRRPEAGAGQAERPGDLLADQQVERRPASRVTISPRAMKFWSAYR